jgi:hypothetical protein
MITNLLRCDMTGSYLTRDGGASYQQINFAGGASSYAWDPIDSNIVYIGSAALNRSVDGGKTWGKIKGYDFHWGQRIVVDPNDPEQVYITTFGSSVWHGIPVVE